MLRGLRKECNGDWYTSLKTCFVSTLTALSPFGDALQGGDEDTRFPGAEKLLNSHDFSITGCRFVTVSLKQVACVEGLPLLKITIANQH